MVENGYSTREIKSISGMKNKTIYVNKTGNIYVNNNVQ